MVFLQAAAKCVGRQSDFRSTRANGHTRNEYSASPLMVWDHRSATPLNGHSQHRRSHQSRSHPPRQRRRTSKTKAQDNDTGSRNRPLHHRHHPGCRSHHALRSTEAREPPFQYHRNLFSITNVKEGHLFSFTNVKEAGGTPGVGSGWERQGREARGER